MQMRETNVKFYLVGNVVANTMSNTRIPSPARSHTGMTPRKHKSLIRRSRSVASPRSTSSTPLTTIIQDAFQMSPLPQRKSILPDDTDVQVPLRKSWWKNLDENSRDMTELLQNADPPEANIVCDDVEMEPPSQDQNFSIDIPDSSDGESINSIIIPQRKLFPYKDTTKQKYIENYKQIIQLDKTKASKSSTELEQDINIAPRSLFNQVKQKNTMKPIFPSSLLNKMCASSALETSVELPMEAKTRNLFGNKPSNKRKSTFINVVVSDNEDESNHSQLKVFDFKRKSIPKPGRISMNSLHSSVFDNIEEDWDHLPSSTMIGQHSEDESTPKRRKSSSVSQEKRNNSMNKENSMDNTLVDNESDIEQQQSKTQVQKSYQEETLKNTSENFINNQNYIEHNKVTNKDRSDITLNTSKSKQHNSKVMPEDNVPVAKENSEVIEKQTTINNGCEKILDLHKNIGNKTDDKSLINEFSNVNSQELNKDENISCHNQVDVDLRKEKHESSGQSILRNNVNTSKNERRMNNSITEFTKDISMQSITKKQNNYIETHSSSNLLNEQNIVEQQREESGEFMMNAILESENESEVETRQSDIDSEPEIEEEQDESERSMIEHETEIDQSVSGTQQEDSSCDQQESDIELDIAEHIENSNNANKSKTDEHRKSFNSLHNTKTNETLTHPETVLNCKKDEVLVEASFVAERRNTSIRKTKSVIINRESLQESTRLSEDAIDSSANNSGWDSHRTTRKTLRQTFGKDFTPRKSLRTLVMEKSAKKQSNVLENAMDTSEVSVNTDQNARAAKSIGRDNLVDVFETNNFDAGVDNNLTERAKNQSNVADMANNTQEQVLQNNQANTSREVLNEISKGNSNISDSNHNSKNDKTSNQSNSNVSDEMVSLSENNESKQSVNEENIDSNIDYEQDKSNLNNSQGSVTETNNKNESARDVNEEAVETHDEDEQDNNDEELVETNDEDANEVTLESEDEGANQENDDEVEMLENIENDNVSHQEDDDHNISYDSDDAQGRNNESEIEAESNNCEDSENHDNAEMVQTYENDDVDDSNDSENDSDHEDVERNPLHDNKEISKMPQANSTEYPMFESMAEPTLSAGKSRKKKQSTQQILEEIKAQNMERKRKIDATLDNWLKTSSKPQNTNYFKAPQKPAVRIAKQSKPKAKPKSNLVFSLPDEFHADLKYKPPKRYQPKNASWATKRLYSFLETKLEPKYDFKARVRAEKLVETIYDFTMEIRRVGVAPAPSVAKLKHEMARLNVATTHFDFYEFIKSFMPKDVRNKVVPSLINNIALPKPSVYASIID
ncbi:unnamed protein product [Leptosia nina]|uniref:Uncharacterized protein n=1 Tax=Leptosia nina TaxID=320188 RepID=A0AAV1JMB3_9NEOP